MAALDERFRALSKAGRSVAFHETIQLFPLSNGGQDQNRRSALIPAVLRADPQHIAAASGGNGKTWRTMQAAGRLEGCIDRADLAGLVIMAGDKIRRIDREGQPFYEVRAVDTNHAHDIILDLNEVR